MVSVRCMVEECKYNASLYCAAEKIQVRSSGTKRVDDPDKTACSTFYSRQNP